MTTDNKALADRLLDHALLHETFCYNDQEQVRWARDLREAAAALTPPQEVKARGEVSDEAVEAFLSGCDPNREHSAIQRDLTRKALESYEKWIATTPQPQGDASPQVPSREALLIIVQSVCGALERAGLTDCDDPGKAIDAMRERYEARIADLSVVPQPACNMDGSPGHTQGSFAQDSGSLDNAAKSLDSALSSNPQVSGGGDAASQIRGLIAEIDPPRKPATGEIKLIADQLRHTLAALPSPQARPDGGAVPFAWLGCKSHGGGHFERKTIFAPPIAEDEAAFDYWTPAYTHPSPKADVTRLVEAADALAKQITFRIDDPRCELHCKLMDELQPYTAAQQEGE